MQIRLIEGLHLTATNKRHLAEIISQGLTCGESRRLAYNVQAIAGRENHYHYCIRKTELSDWGKPQVRESRGIIAVLSKSYRETGV